MLVETAWVAEHGKDAGIRLVEVDVDTAAYSACHVGTAAPSIMEAGTSTSSDPNRSETFDGLRLRL